jgi:hypothetical protein
MDRQWFEGSQRTILGSGNWYRPIHTPRSQEFRYVIGHLEALETFCSMLGRIYIFVLETFPWLLFTVGPIREPIRTLLTIRTCHCYSYLG